MKAEDVMPGEFIEASRYSRDDLIRDDLMVVTEIIWTDSGKIKFVGYFITDGHPFRSVDLDPHFPMDVWNERGMV